MVTETKQLDDLKNKHTANTLLHLMGRYFAMRVGLRRWKTLPLIMKINILPRNM